MAIELSKAVYPPSLQAPLERIGYEIDIDTQKSRENAEFLWKDLADTLSARRKAFDLLWKEDWDYFEFVITGTDRLHHFQWDAYEDENHVYHQNFLAYYGQIDRVIDEIVTSFLKLTDDDKGLYLLSDHGFAQIEQEVYLNAWLEEQGYLSFNNPSPESLADISTSSRAFVMEPNRVYLNLREKFPEGCVEPSGKNDLKEEISKKLEKLEYKGKKVVRCVFDAEEIYSGPYVPEGPDLIVLSESGFDMKGSVKKKEVFGRSKLQGMHTWDDAFFWSKKEQNQDLSISDLTNIILDNFS
jgi:predicted AlkP superfamily phosphohydrolase/phosphomutase